MPIPNVKMVASRPPCANEKPGSERIVGQNDREDLPVHGIDHI